jgi:hypothetical protein
MEIQNTISNQNSASSYNGNNKIGAMVGHHKLSIPVEKVVRYGEHHFKQFRYWEEET